MTNRQLRETLLKKLGIGQGALYERAKKLTAQYPMTTEDAIYVIAQQEGIRLAKYLDKETIDHVRSLFQHISYPTKALPYVSKATQRGKGTIKDQQRVIVIGTEFRLTDPILQPKRISEAKEMGAIYPLLYVLENSIREVVDRFMTSTYGDKWWDSKAPKGLRDTVSNRMSDEQKNSWHQRRGARPIDYLDLNQLPALMRKIEKEVVPNIIPSLEWFTQLVDEVYKSRCVVCHMNPLDTVNTQSIKIKFTQWQKQISAKKSLIPELKP